MSFLVKYILNSIMFVVIGGINVSVAVLNYYPLTVGRDTAMWRPFL